MFRPLHAAALVAALALSLPAHAMQPDPDGEVRATVAATSSALKAGAKPGDLAYVTDTGTFWIKAAGATGWVRSNTIPADLTISVRNETGSTIAKGAPVYVSGWSETYTRPLVALADADAAGKRAAFVMPASCTTVTNCSAAKTLRLTAVDTSATAVGDPWYLSATAGATTKTAPTAANAIVQILGRVAVVHASAGVVEFDLFANNGLSSIGTNELQAAAVTVPKGGTGLATMGAVGAIPTGGTAGTGAMVALPDDAVGSVLTSGGATAIPVWAPVRECISSSATTCTITAQRSGCKPICSQSVGTPVAATCSQSTTTTTCTFSSGSYTFDCICP